jgi:hypothetical protein
MRDDVTTMHLQGRGLLVIRPLRFSFLDPGTGGFVSFDDGAGQLRGFCGPFNASHPL